MKRSSALFIIIFLTIIFASCSKSDDEKSPSSIMDSYDFYEEITIPEQLSIDFNLDDIKKLEKAKTYHAVYQIFDEQKLIDAFIQHEVMERKIWAEGPQILASAPHIQEYLNIYDGGKAYGLDDGMEGGFIYGRSKDDFDNYAFNMVANPQFINSGLMDEGIPNSNYASFADLDFLPYEEALTDITKTMNAAGIASFKVDETYSLDLETIENHYEIYLENNSELVEKQYENLKWTKEHETYIFSLQQLVNDIPIINKGWDLPDGTKASAFGNPMPTTYIHLAYDNEKIREITANNILAPTEELEEVTLVSLYDALATLVNDYSLTILEEDVRIISAELSYLSIPKDDQFELIPGWVFRSAKEITFEGDPLTEYKTDVVNAVNGKLYQGRW